MIIKKKIKPGKFQLAIVILFIIISFVLSKMFENDSMENQNYVSSERLLYAKIKNITPAEHQISFTTSATVEAKHEVGIIPQVSGRIVWVNEKLFKGEAFDKNEPLFEIDRSDYDLEVVQFDAEVAKANTALNIELAETKVAIDEWKQFNGDLDAPDLVTRKPHLIEAHSRLKAALAQREKARLNLSRTIYKLPFNGQVIESNMAEGQFVMTGQAYGKVYDNRSMELHSFMSDKQLKWLLNSHDSGIEIIIMSYGTEKIFKGHLRRNATSVDKSTRFAHVRFAFNEPPTQILIGSFAKINVKGELHKNAAIIPSHALQKDGKILIVNNDNIISKFQPEIIQTMDKHIAIKGLNKPFKVIVNNMPGAIDGMKVATDDEIN